MNTPLSWLLTGLAVMILGIPVAATLLSAVELPVGLAFVLPSLVGGPMVTVAVIAKGVQIGALSAQTRRHAS